MTEGVQASTLSDGGGTHRLTGALAPVVMGAAAALSSWTTGSANMSGDILLVAGIALVGAGIALLVLRIPVHGPRDYFGGLALLALALFAIWASSDLPGMHGFAFGPGTAPRLFSLVLGGAGVMVAVIGLFAEGPGLERFAIRGPLFITVSTIVFAIMIRHFGLVIASFVSIVVSALGSSESKWLETILWGAFLSAFCAVLFPYVLNLPMPLWPQNLALDNMFSIR